MQGTQLLKQAGVVFVLAWVLPATLVTFTWAARHSNGHTSNWAVLVCTSKYWYNYRHIANTLSFYRTVKRLGIPDSNIILMLAEDVACNPRNAYASQVFNDESHRLNVYGDNVEVDYRGYEVTVENFIRVLTGRHDPAVPRPKRMLSDTGSNVLVYISGHGGNEFMKFQDTAELMAQDVADAVAQMHQKGRYRELLLIVETCQAATLYSRMNSPNVLAMASSLKGESSYSYLTDMDVGLSLIDRFTWSTLEFFEKVDIHSNLTLQQLVEIYRFEALESHFDYDAARYPNALNEVPVTSFFGSVSNPQPMPALQQSVGDVAIGSSGDMLPAGAAGDCANSEKRATVTINEGGLLQLVQRQAREHTCSYQSDGVHGQSAGSSKKNQVCWKSKLLCRTAAPDAIALYNAYAGLVAMLLVVAVAGKLLGKPPPCPASANPACV